MENKKFNRIDQFLNEIENALRVVNVKAPTTERANPAENIDNDDLLALSDSEIKLSSSLMRVNHAGEIAAQGLYRGQALTSKSEKIRAQMKVSANEENDHLNWCESRLEQLESHKSYLSPLWYVGSFGLGALAGLAGDKLSLGFVKETEDQVGRHIDSHLVKLPKNDNASRAILEQMKADEAHHAQVAVDAGAEPLPLPIRKFVMPLMSKLMTTVSAKI